MQATKGLNIGSGVASLAASLLEEVELGLLKSWCESNSIWMELKAFIDNVFIITTAVDALRILAQLESRGRSVGLLYSLRESHPHKIHFPFPQRLTRALQEWQRHFAGFEFSAADDSLAPQQQGIKLAGALIGSRRFYEMVAESKLLKAKEATELVVEHARPQEAVVLLRTAIIPSLDFVRRMLPGWVTREMAEAFDMHVARAVQRVAGGFGNWAEERQKFLWLFQGDGLPGFRRLGTTTEAAEIGSFVAAARNLGPTLALPRIIMQAITGYNGRVGSGKVKVDSTAELLHAMAKIEKVQKHLARHIFRTEAPELRGLLGQEDLYKMDAMQAKKAGIWRKDLDFGTIFDPGVGARLAMRDDYFRYHMRRGMPGRDPHGTGLPHLVCKECLTAYSTRMTHAETCCRAVRGANRHNAFQEAVMKLVHALGGFARASGVSMWVPPQCLDQMPPCDGCDHCAKTQSVRVDVEFGGVGADGLYSVDVANVEILTKDVRYTLIPNSSRFDVHAPIRKEELRKSNLYAQLCRERSRQFIPTIMSSYGAPGEGMGRMVAILAERLQRLIGGTDAACKRRILRRLQTANMIEIARNGTQALVDHRLEIHKARVRRERRQQDEDPPQDEVLADILASLRSDRTEL